MWGLGGSESHGLLFSLLAKHDSSLGDKLHQTTVNPFSIGPVRGRGKRSEGRYFLVKDVEYSLSFSALDQEVGNFLKQMLGKTFVGFSFRLGTAACTVTETKCLLSSSYQKLVLDVREAEAVKLKFTAPTAFRSQGVLLLYPQPELVFQSLQDRWNSFSPWPIHLEDIKTNIFVSRYNLSTKYINFPKYGQTGFTGEVIYSINRAWPQEYRWQVVTLGRYGAYSGVGYKTGMGMGETSVSF